MVVSGNLSAFRWYGYQCSALLVFSLLGMKYCCIFWLMLKKVQVSTETVISIISIVVAIICLMMDR